MGLITWIRNLLGLDPNEKTTDIVSVEEWEWTEPNVNDTSESFIISSDVLPDSDIHILKKDAQGYVYAPYKIETVTQVFDLTGEVKEEILTKYANKKVNAKFYGRLSIPAGEGSQGLEPIINDYIKKHASRGIAQGEITFPESGIKETHPMAKTHTYTSLMGFLTEEERKAHVDAVIKGAEGGYDFSYEIDKTLDKETIERVKVEKGDVPRKKSKKRR